MQAPDYLEGLMNPEDNCYYFSSLSYFLKCYNSDMLHYSETISDIPFPVSQLYKRSFTVVKALGEKIRRFHEEKKRFHFRNMVI